MRLYLRSATLMERAANVLRLQRIGMSAFIAPEYKCTYCSQNNSNVMTQLLQAPGQLLS